MAYNTGAYVKVGTSFQRVNYPTHWNIIDGMPTNFPPTAHNHDASNINAGTLSKDRIPTTLNDVYTRNLFVSPDGVPSSNLGSPTVAEMALFQEQFNNKTAFYDITKIKFYTSSDNVNWTEYTGFTDDNKRKFVGGDATSTINIPNNTPYFRIEIENDGNYVYLNALYMYWSSSGHSSKVRIWKKPHNTQVWGMVTNSNSSVSSWPGHLYLPFPTIPFQLNGTTNADAIRIEFENTWNLNSTTNPSGWNLPIYLFKMQIWGGYPAGKRTIYAVDENKVVSFPADVKSGGQALVKTNDSRFLRTIGYPTALTANDDLNTFTTPGYYSASSGSIVNSLVNRPIGGGECSLRVELLNSVLSTNYLKQTFSVNSAGVLRVFERYKTTTWSAWKEIAFDIYSWAKASTKPTYTYSEVGAAASGHNHSGVYEPANANIQTHVTSTHAPSNAQKNSDITKAEIEAQLTGAITSHTHAYVPTARKVNGKALSEDITLGGTDIAFTGTSGALLTNGEDIDTSLGILESAIGGKLATNGTAYDSTRWNNKQARYGSYSSGASGYITFSYT